jgi:hypothetical protein
VIGGAQGYCLHNLLSSIVYSWKGTYVVVFNAQASQLSRHFRIIGDAYGVNVHYCPFHFRALISVGSHF